ncbi:uncharacterized protein [Paramisgurnus dabryanus]|uniref:uncharacterized protein isoform X1 n=1 Tax=Paramisgurnus dabryanus TaxID=90735 RepID=UPI0031F46DE0
MACAQQSAAEYLRTCRCKLVTHMENFPLIIENLYQQKVFNDHDVDALKAERTEFDKARCILDWVIKKGEMASYELLKILDFTRRRTLHPELHHWISIFSFREDADMPVYLLGTKPCQSYQIQLKKKAEDILKNQWQQNCKYLQNKAQANFSYVPLVLETDAVVKTAHCKIKMKCNKVRKLRPKKLRSYIPDKQEALTPEDLLKWKDKNILLIGKPGIGKTTVVQQILKTWTEKENKEPDYMFYFDESVLSHSSNLVNLESFLFDMNLKPNEKDRKEIFQDIEENSENVVIVFDGVSSVHKHFILKKIMNHELLPEAKIIITCRSELEDDPDDFDLQKVYVQGFSEESIRNYYQMMLGHNPDLLNVVLNNQEMFSLSYVPMYAFMTAVFFLFKNDTELQHSHTVTEMYIHIFRDALKKHGRKTLGQIDQYINEIKEQLYFMMKNAFSATEQKNLNLPEISGDQTDICSVFLKTITIRDSPTSAVTHCAFLHNTMQEFFSALWLLVNPDDIEKVLKLCQTEENKHMRYVLHFLCGLLGEHNIKLLKSLLPEDQMKKTSDWLIEKLLDTFLQPQNDDTDIDLLYVCQCLYELQSSKACLMFLEKMNHQLEPDVNLDPHQCCALSYVISQSRDKEVYLNLEDCTVSDTGMKLILSCSPKIRIKLCDEPLKEIQCLLQFFHKVSQCKQKQQKDEITTSCCCTYFDPNPYKRPDLNRALLDLYCHVKDYETETGRSFLPALQSVYIQSAPHVWIINLSERKTSILLEVLKLQTEKKPVELINCTDEESQVMSLLHCLPYISQLRFQYNDTSAVIKCVLKLFIKASETEPHTGHQMLKLLTSVCTYRYFPYEWINDDDAQSDFLLDLCSHVKDYESQTGRSLLPALQSVYIQSAPHVWIINLSERKSSILLEVLKLQTEKKPVELRDCTDEESQVMSLLHCLPYISQLRFHVDNTSAVIKCVLKLFIKASETEAHTGDQMLKLLTSVCTYRSFPYEQITYYAQMDFLLDLYSHVKDYESQTGRSLLPALQSVYQSAAPDVWIINLSKRKTSILLEVLKLQTQKKPVKLRDCTDEESQVMSLLHCLPHISQLRFEYSDDETHRISTVRFLLRICVTAVNNDINTGTNFISQLSSVCSYRTFPYHEKYNEDVKDFIKKSQSDFLLGLYSHVKDYESQTGRSLLPALQSVYQSPDVWIINLSERKTSILLEVLKLQTEKKPVKLRDCTDEESQVMSLLHCLPYISQLRFQYNDTSAVIKCVLKLFIKASETEAHTGDQMLKLLTSVCTYRSFPYEQITYYAQMDFLLDLCSHVKDYESQTGRSLLPALQSVYQSPDVWIINLSERKTSILLEVLKLQTEKKPVELIDCTDEESQVMILLHCLPYISQLRFYGSYDETQRMSTVKFLLRICDTAVKNDNNTGTNFITQLSSVCSYETFPYNRKCYDDKNQSDFLLDLYSDVKDVESQPGRSLLPVLHSVYKQSSPDVWIINLSERKTSILLEVLKLQTEKKPVKLRDWTDEESQVMSLLHCLPYISQLRFYYSDDETQRMSKVRFLMRICVTAVNNDINTGTNFITQLSSVCSYETFPYHERYYEDKLKQSDFLLDLYCHVKDYESQTGGSLLPALQSVYQSPDVWIINLSERKTSILLEVLKLQTEKKPVKLRDWTDEESQVMSLLHCLPYISQLRFENSDDETQRMSAVRFLLRICVTAVNNDINTETNFITQLSSVCSYKTLPYYENYQSLIDWSDFLLGLYSHVKDYESQTGRSLLPALQSVYQSPDVWIINLSERKTSILLEVLKLQTEKKPVKLRDCTDDESQVMSLLHCLPYISQLRFYGSYDETQRMSTVRFLLRICDAAVNNDINTGTNFITQLSSVCSYRTFPYHEEYESEMKQSDFLLDLYSDVKDYETQTGRSLLPVLQSFYKQSAPDVWIINLSERKTSILLEVLKLQTEKKPVKLRDCTDDESQVMSLLHCLPYISQLRFQYNDTSAVIKCVLKLFIKASETEAHTGDQMLKLLTSVCTYRSFPHEWINDDDAQSDFLLDLCSHVKDYESQTGRSLLPALQSVYIQSAPDVWIINLSERKTSILLEVLKLQTEKKPVELIDCTDEESQVMSLLHCLPYISQLRFYVVDTSAVIKFVLKLFIKASETEAHTGDQMLKLLTSVCTYRSFPYEQINYDAQSDFLLDLCSHVKNYESQTGRSLLPALQSVYQSAPDVWTIKLSKRKISILLEVLKLQTEKKPVELIDCTDEEDEESQVMSLLHCLPYISQLRFDCSDDKTALRFLLRLCDAAVNNDNNTGTNFITQLSSVCSYKTFPYNEEYYDYDDYIKKTQRDFLLDLYSHVKDYASQTGRSLLPALQSVYQSPDVWIINLSERKISILLEVLKLQTEKKPVKLINFTDEESQVMSLLHCLPYISQLRFDYSDDETQQMSTVKFLLRICDAAVNNDINTGTKFITQLSSVCSYKTFPYDDEYYDDYDFIKINQSDFLLDLCSHVKNYESQTGRSLLPALQSVYQSPDVWIINLSERKTSILLEVLKLQTEKKPVELRDCTDDESQVMSLLQCLPYISQLSGDKRCVLSLVKLVQFRENPDLVMSLFQALDFNLSLEGKLPSSTCRFVGEVLHLSADKLTFTVKPQVISLRGTRLLFRRITNIHTLRLSGYMVLRIVRALRSSGVGAPISVNELSLDLNDKQRSEMEMSRVLSSLSSLLRLWTVRCLNLTECRMKSLSLTLLLCQQSPATLRLSKEIFQTLAECVYEAQEEEVTLCFLQKMGGDLTSCSFPWEKLHYFLQCEIPSIILNLKERNTTLNIREILPFLNKIHFQRMSSTFMLCLILEIYESRSSVFVFSLLSSVKNCINLQSRSLDSVHCAALRFILQHCTAVTLNMMWTSIPEEELESIQTLFSHVSCLSVDRRLLLRMIHCCSSSDVQQEASVVLLSALQHKLDFTCGSALDLTENTQTLQLTAEDCRVISAVIQRAYKDTQTLTQLSLHDCEINTAGIHQLFSVLHSVKLRCDKSILLQFLSHVGPGEAESLSQALGEEVDLSQTQLDLQVCRGLALVLDHSEGLTELDLSQCHLTDQSLDLLLPNLHKAEIIDFSGNNITDAGAQKIYNILSQYSNIKTVRLFNNRIESSEILYRDPRFEIW